MESIRDTVFFAALSTEFLDRLREAQSRTCLICVPQSWSLTAKVTLDDIDNHILFLTSDQGVFGTRHGRLVRVQGSELHALRGFAQPRRVRILISCSMTDASLLCSGGGSSAAVADAAAAAAAAAEAQGVRSSLLLVSHPLEGGISAPTTLPDMTRQAARGTLGMLRMAPENEPAFHALDGFVRCVRAQAALDPACLLPHSLSPALRRQCDGAVRRLLPWFKCPRTGAGAASAAQMAELQLQVLVTSYVVEQLHDDVMRAMRDHDGARLRRFAVQVSALRAAAEPEALRVRPEFCCDLRPAAALLPQLATRRGPLEKAQCLQEVSDTVRRLVEQRAVDAYGQHGGAPVSFDLTTDDLLALLLNVLVLAWPAAADLPLQLSFIENYCTLPLYTSHLGYTFANFEVMSEYLLQLGDHRSPPPRGRASSGDDDDDDISAADAAHAASGLAAAELRTVALAEAQE